MTRSWMMLLILVLLQSLLWGQDNKPSNAIDVLVPPLDTGAFRIPGRDEIKEVYVEVFNSHIKLPDIDSFKVDTKHIDKIYQYFEGAEVDREPLVLFPDIGSVRLKLKSGETVRVAIHSISAKAPQNFSILGVRLRQNRAKWVKSGESEVYEGLVRRIYFWQTGHYTFKVSDSVLKEQQAERE